MILQFQFVYRDSNWTDPSDLLCFRWSHQMSSFSLKVQKWNFQLQYEKEIDAFHRGSNPTCWPNNHARELKIIQIKSTYYRESFSRLAS